MIYDPFGINYKPQTLSQGEIVTGDFNYSSSIDDINNLYAHYSYNDAGYDLPIVILMHGYTQDSTSMTNAIMKDMAEYGFFACAVGMRGRDGASGSIDVSGRELYDIVDAVEYIKSNFTNVDGGQIHVSGYSGGGGNVFGLAAKFPDYFNTLISHFGISDYGYDSENSWWHTNPTRQQSLEGWIGFTPDNNLGAYYSRAHQLGIGKNFKGGYLWMFHDSGDSNVPPIQSEMVKTEMDNNGLTNYTLDITTPSDEPRWIHASPHLDQPVRLTREMFWGNPVLDKSYNQWEIENIGEMLVQGYLKTKKFEMWLGNGQEHVAELNYNVLNDSYTITPLSGEVEVEITQGNKTATQTISTETTITVS